MSVVASEMSGEAPFAFLKAHAIASRSWLVAMLRRGKGREGERTGKRRSGREGEIVRWYDREDHSLFDVCADDHCQRYQGITGRVSGRAAEAVRETRGVFLIHEGEDLRRPLPQGVRRADRELRDLLGGEIGSLSLPCFRLRKTASPDPDGGGCGAVDPLLPRCLLPHEGSGPPPAYPSRIRPGDGRFFPLAGQLRKGGAGGDSSGKIGDRLRRPAQSRTAGTRPLRTDPPASDRGVEGHGRRGKGTGDPPLALAEPPVQQRLHRLHDPGSFRDTGPLHSLRGGLGTRRRPLPDRGRRDGREGIHRGGDPPALLPRGGAGKAVLTPCSS